VFLGWPPPGGAPWQEVQPTVSPCAQAMVAFAPFLNAPWQHVLEQLDPFQAGAGVTPPQLAFRASAPNANATMPFACDTSPGGGTALK
jgi:hypothetical protein